jgi:cell division septation protein DedD
MRHAGLRPAADAPAPGIGSQKTWTIDPAHGPDHRRAEASVWRKPSHERLSISKLFEHMDPQPRSYREDAYEDAQKITHTAPRQLAVSPAAVSALVAGSIATLFVIFVAGFLSAVLIFGEPNAGGELAILPSQPQQASQPVPSIPQDGAAIGDNAAQSVRETRATIPQETTRVSEGLVTSATANRDQQLAPSPEIAAAESARDTALQSPAPVFTAPQTPSQPSVDELGPKATIATDTIIYPGAKPSQPARSDVASQAASVLGGPGGNYSLQFGAFRDKSNAAVLVRELTPTAKAGIVAEEGATGEPLFYVRAGAFQTRAEALEAVKSLRGSAGIVTFVHANRGTG